MSYVGRDGGMHIYSCDGMPTLQGCGAETRTTRPYVKASMQSKSSGWLVCYATGDDGRDDTEFIMHFCPSCAAVVRAQVRKR